ncbi:MAG: hypothetical protein ACRDQ5_02200 [Sciscionella sp.]
MVPSLGPSHGKLTFVKNQAAVTPAIKSFLDGGVPYDTDMGGKGGPIRLDSDHSSKISRASIIKKLSELGYVTGKAKEPKTKIEFVTHAVDELAPASNKEFQTLNADLQNNLNAALTAAQSGTMTQLAAPAKPGYFTGVPVADLKSWLGGDYAQVKGLVDHFLGEQIADEVYLQATVGIIPSGVRTFLATAKLPGGKVHLNPSSEARKQVLGIVKRVITRLEKRKKFVEDPWIKDLGKSGHEAFMGILSLVYSYLLGDTLHQTTAGTTSTAKNAVPFLIKHGPWNLTQLAGTDALRGNPPPKALARYIGEVFKNTKYLTAKYWIETGKRTATGEDKIKKPVEARVRKKGFLRGDYVDVVEALLTSGGGGVTARLGKELPGVDSLPTDSGGVNVRWESYDQKGIPLEYRWITKKYTVAQLLPALNEIIKEVRVANMRELTAEQKEKVDEAVKSG